MHCVLNFFAIKLINLNLYWAHVISTGTVLRSDDDSKCCVNALSRAHSISTRYNKLWKGGEMMCQCPVSAHSISTKSSLSCIQSAAVCQCPVSGSLHFYGTAFKLTVVITEVSMPCLGLTPFLRGIMIHILFHLPDVSMPCLGLTPFLQNEKV